MRDELPPITTFLNRLLALTIDLQNILFTAFEQLLTARIEGAMASGTYDIGLETLTAESFIRHRPADDLYPSRHIRGNTAADHHAAGAQLSGHAGPGAGSAFRQTRRAAGEHAIRPRRRAGSGAQRDARRWRGRTPRAADPADGASRLAAGDDAATQWREADRETFARAWEAEFAQVPEFTDSEIHIVAGLLLPIWKRLPNESSRVYRLQTDAGERIIGRRVSPAWVATALDADTSRLYRPTTRSRR